MPVIFTDEDVQGMVQPHDDALVVMMEIVGKDVFKILVDTKSSVDIIFKHVLERLNTRGSNMEEALASLVGFSGRSVWPANIISLPVFVSNESAVVAMVVKFVSVDQLSPYNIILGRLFMVTTKAYVSLYHIKMKIRAEDIIIIVRGDQKMARSCYVAAFRENLYIGAAENMQRKEVASTTKKGDQTDEY